MRQSGDDSFRAVCEPRQVAFCGVEAGHLPAFKEVVAGSEEQEAWYRYCGGGKWDHLPINQRPEETSYAMEISLLADAPAPSEVYVSNRRMARKPREGVGQLPALLLDQGPLPLTICKGVHSLCPKYRPSGSTC